MKTAIELAKKAGFLHIAEGFVGQEPDLEKLLALHREQVLKELAGGSLEPVAWRYKGDISYDRYNGIEGASPLYAAEQLAAAKVQEREECAEIARGYPKYGEAVAEEILALNTQTQEQKK